MRVGPIKIQHNPFISWFITEQNIITLMKTQWWHMSEKTNIYKDKYIATVETQKTIIKTT